MTLQTAELIDHLDAEGTQLIRTAEQVVWDAPWRAWAGAPASWCGSARLTA